MRESRSRRHPRRKPVSAPDQLFAPTPLAHLAKQAQPLRAAPNQELYEALTRLSTAAENLGALHKCADDQAGGGAYWLAMNDAVHSLSRATVELQNLCDGMTRDLDDVHT